MGARWTVHELEELLVIYCERVHPTPGLDHRGFARAIAPELYVMLEHGPGSYDRSMEIRDAFLAHRMPMPAGDWDAYQHVDDMLRDFRRSSGSKLTTKLIAGRLWNRIYRLFGWELPQDSMTGNAVIGGRG